MEKTWMPTVAGILDIVAGGLSLLGLIFVILGISVFAIAGSSGLSCPVPMPTPIGPAFVILIMAIPVLIADILAIVGGIYALKGKKWGWALTGSIAALIAFWPLGIAAIVFTVMSQKEFD